MREDYITRDNRIKIGRTSINVVAPRFKDEKVALHWQVDETDNSFKRLLYHLEKRTNFKPFFEEALRALAPSDKSVTKESMTVADIGAGVCWTSAILANQPYVKHVYAVEPSEERLKHAEFVLKHFKVSEDKITLVKGTFAEPKVPENVDLLLLCGALHHCYDEDIPALFSNIKDLLAKGGKVLIANDHYVNFFWVVIRFLSFIKNFKNRKEKGISLTNLRAPDPFSGEHWRTRKEIEDIFSAQGFKASIFIHDGDLCKDKPYFYLRAGWKYYYALLERM